MYGTTKLVLTVALAALATTTAALANSGHGNSYGHGNGYDWSRGPSVHRPGCDLRRDVHRNPCNLHQCHDRRGRVVVVRPVVRTVVVERPVEHVVYQPAPCVQPTTVRSESRGKVRTRNAVLIAAAANELFNKGSSSRKDIREGALVATLVNELFRR